ncbi:MAG: RAMP superfamily CRISPR-associated protein [Desulfobulbaceae bacterium]|jgi:CRISPR-associated protein Cmr4|nr:RAMP superfamily CRISPR-associated protein [Desulfobulbaceae bacterium]
MMNAYLLRLEMLTDLHVGGEGGMGLVENEAQRDSVIQDVPIIPGSGVKGALREHFAGKLAKEQEKLIFGYPPSQSKEGESSKPPPQSGDGKYKFFDAFCVARPLRVSKGNHAYVLTTSVEIIEHFFSLMLGVGFGNGTEIAAARKEIANLPWENSKFLCSPGAEIQSIEGENAPETPTLAENCPNLVAYISKLIPKPWAICQSLRPFDLPTRARNCLDDKKRNLWYEEYVPHKSIFYAPMLTPDEEKHLSFNEPVQFGANGSVGMGYAKVTCLNTLDAGENQP